ncbi:hypothetical protein [Nocardia cyriacigeorgica]|uniref:hypothetical protein n=1 Tax=Nocardia cyriacigeorgica TaxID=135487 RepID=UPI000CE9E093|nr:hypothetical protein [Nocardia cyriacigeorgica]PPJ13727.1 hypothetical protein C5E43_08925 [Nocardia cyriacigeorgica]
MPRDPDRYTAGRLDTDLRRIVRKLIDHAPRPVDERPMADPDLAALEALASIAAAVDAMIDRHIVSARRPRTPPARLDDRARSARAVGADRRSARDHRPGRGEARSEATPSGDPADA